MKTFNKKDFLEFQINHYEQRAKEETNSDVRQWLESQLLFFTRKYKAEYPNSIVIPVNNSGNFLHNRNGPNICRVSFGNNIFSNN